MDDFEDFKQEQKALLNEAREAELDMHDVARFIQALGDELVDRQLMEKDIRPPQYGIEAIDPLSVATEEDRNTT